MRGVVSGSFAERAGRHRKLKTLLTTETLSPPFSSKSDSWTYGSSNDSDSPAPASREAAGAEGLTVARAEARVHCARGASAGREILRAMAQRQPSSVWAMTVRRWQLWQRDSRSDDGRSEGAATPAGHVTQTSLLNFNDSCTSSKAETEGAGDA